MRAHWILSVTLVVTLLALPVRSAEPQTFGTGVSLSDTTPLARVLDRPADFEGRTVRVEGVVTSVCSMMGCWMALATADSPGGSTMLVKVDDGVIVFPVSAKGHRASAQGVVERVGGDAEGREAAAEHAKAEGKSKADAAAHWQIKATGAVVY